MMNYILLTPLKNEKKYLPYLIQSVVSQTVLPKIWVIIDGGSTDGSLRILKDFSRKHDWIYIKEQENFSDDGGHINFALGVREGYEYAKTVCSDENVKYDYVGKIDADALIPPNFFERLMEELEKNHQIGVASGIQYTLKPGVRVSVYEDIRETDVNKNYFLPDEIPDKRLYRKEYLEEVGGFPISKFSPDTVLLAKFRINGWSIQSFEDLKIYNLREDTGIERDVWESAKLMGQGRYYLNYHPLLLLLGALYLFTKKPHYHAFGYIFGYIYSLMNKKEKIDDQIIKEYFRWKRLVEILKLV